MAATTAAITRATTAIRWRFTGARYRDSGEGSSDSARRLGPAGLRGAARGAADHQPFLRIAWYDEDAVRYPATQPYEQPLHS